MRALVTGGAGFIGSHVVDSLLAEKAEVVVLDNFSTGREDFLTAHSIGTSLRVIRGDVLDFATVRGAIRGCDTVFHFQANADVRGGVRDTRVDLDQNVLATWNVLEAAREAGVGQLVFASSATVYGEPEVFPTPETFAGSQTSLYGASKLAAEALCEAFAEYFGFRCLILRFTSCIGERYTHGVIADFVRKLRDDRTVLDVLGDGTQRKAYLYVNDAIDGIRTALRCATGPKHRFNLGHHETVTVLELSRIVLDELDLADVELRFAGGPRGWPGDSPHVELDLRAIRALGWSPKISIEDGIRRTVRHLQANPGLLSSPRPGSRAGT